MPRRAVPRCLTPAQRKAFFLLPEPPRVVHRAGEVALPHRRMETVAQRHPRRQKPIATRCRVAVSARAAAEHTYA